MRVTPVDVDPDTASQGMPERPVRDGLAAMFRAYAAHGFHGGNNLVLTSILGRPPRTLDAFFAEPAH